MSSKVVLVNAGPDVAVVHVQNGGRRSTQATRYLSPGESAEIHMARDEYIHVALRDPAPKQLE